VGDEFAADLVLAGGGVKGIGHVGGVAALRERGSELQAQASQDGHEATSAFLDGWDFEAYVRRFRQEPVSA
jgi:hypothetical protein